MLSFWSIVTEYVYKHCCYIVCLSHWNLTCLHQLKSTLKEGNSFLYEQTALLKRQESVIESKQVMKVVAHVKATKNVSSASILLTKRHYIHVVIVLSFFLSLW